MRCTLGFLVYSILSFGLVAHAVEMTSTQLEELCPCKTDRDGTKMSDEDAALLMGTVQQGQAK